jgi:hypothetical protein
MFYQLGDIERHSELDVRHLRMIGDAPPEVRIALLADHGSST